MPTLLPLPFKPSITAQLPSILSAPISFDLLVSQINLFPCCNNNTLTLWILLSVSQPDLDLFLDISHSWNYQLPQDLYKWLCVCLIFHHSCNKCLLHVYYLPGNELGTRYSSQKKCLTIIPTASKCIHKYINNNISNSD